MICMSSDIWYRRISRGPSQTEGKHAWRANLMHGLPVSFSFIFVVERKCSRILWRKRVCFLSESEYKVMIVTTILSFSVFFLYLSGKAWFCRTVQGMVLPSPFEPRLVLIFFLVKGRQVKKRQGLKKRSHYYRPIYSSRFLPSYEVFFPSFFFFSFCLFLFVHSFELFRGPELFDFDRFTKVVDLIHFGALLSWDRKKNFKKDLPGFPRDLLCLIGASMNPGKADSVDSPQNDFVDFFEVPLPAGNATSECNYSPDFCSYPAKLLWRIWWSGREAWRVPSRESTSTTVPPFLLH